MIYYWLKKKKVESSPKYHILMLQFQFLWQILPRYLLCKLDKQDSVFQSWSWCSFQRMSSHSCLLPPKFSNFGFQLCYCSWINTFRPGDLMLFSLCIGYLIYSIVNSVWNLSSTFHTTNNVPDVRTFEISCIKTIHVNIYLDLLQYLCVPALLSLISSC